MGNRPITSDTHMTVTRFELLAQRELQALSLLADGLDYNQIAVCMSISINGVRSHIKGIYRKLDVKNSVQASRIYW